MPVLDADYITQEDLVREDVSVSDDEQPDQQQLVSTTDGKVWVGV